MKDYNGFSGAKRQETFNIQKSLGIAQEAAKQPCCMCHGKGGYVIGHTENYNDPYDVKPVCVECHMRLHGRFHNPGAWINHLLRLKHGWKPVQWTSVGQFIGNQKRVKANFYKEFENVDPATIGSEWYHQLKMFKINLNQL